MAETKKYLTMKERICFTVGAFGRSGIYTLMSMFTLVFFQNGAGLTLKQGTTIILIGRVFATPQRMYVTRAQTKAAVEPSLNGAEKRAIVVIAIGIGENKR